VLFDLKNPIFNVIYITTPTSDRQTTLHTTPLHYTYGSLSYKARVSFNEGRQIKEA
jgi:hypothetical protein